MKNNLRTIHAKRGEDLAQLARTHFGEDAVVPEFFDPQDVIGYIQVGDSTVYAVVPTQAADQYRFFPSSESHE